jgi:hypothetical protein
MTAERTIADVHQDIDAAQEEFKRLALLGHWDQGQAQYDAKLMPLQEELIEIVCRDRPDVAELLATKVVL